MKPNQPLAIMLKQAETALISDAHWNFFMSKPGAMRILDVASVVYSIDGRSNNQQRVEFRRQMRSGINT